MTSIARISINLSKRIGAGIVTGISLIIPIYNVEHYIEACLQSVIQSMLLHLNVEVILVNDGSTDQSGEIAQKYAEEFSHLKYIEKRNGGVASARNLGIQYAQYPYIAFLDSDDMVDIHYFHYLLDAIHSSPDLVIFNAKNFDGKTNTDIIKGIDVPGEVWTIEPNMGTKLFHRKLFEELSFSEGMFYEDACLMYKLIYFVKNVVYIDEALHVYRTNRKGRTMNTISPKINDIYRAFAEIYQFYQNKNALTEKNLQGMSYQFIKLVMWNNTYRQMSLLKFRFHQFYKKMHDTRTELYTLFPNWKTNELLALNESYFTERLGDRYIVTIDALGKSIISTFISTIYITYKNFLRI